MRLHSISFLTFPVFPKVILEIYLYAFTFHSQYSKVISVLSMQRLEILYINYIFVTDRASAKISQLRETSLCEVTFISFSFNVRRRSKKNRKRDMAWIWMSYSEIMLIPSIESKACATSHRFFCPFASQEFAIAQSLSKRFGFRAKALLTLQWPLSFLFIPFSSPIPSVNVCGNIMWVIAL